MANSRSSSVSSAAADTLLRQKLRGSASPAAEEPQPTNGNFDSGLGLNGANGAHANGLSPEAAATNGHSESNGLPLSGNVQASPAVPANGSSFESLRQENDELHRLVEEMKVIFGQAAEQEAENAKIIEAQTAQMAALEQAANEKDARLEMLNAQIHELETHIQQAVPPPPPTEDELSKMADELEKERCQLTKDRKTLDGERQQIRDDEEDMMRQMREMEISMAKERAEMARQKTEIQRLHSEIKRELELLQGSDRALTDRLVQFQRRHQDLSMRGGGAPAPAQAATTKPPPAAAPAADPPDKKDSGLFNRFFKRK
jgi:hypothetical protein